MTAADDAYRQAEAAIEQARREGATELDFSGEAFHPLTALPPSLSSLTGLTTLHLDNTQISDLTPLAALTGLTDLRLGNTQVSDLTPLAQLTSLTGLWLGYTQVSDLTPLAALTGLTSLRLTATQVSDLTPLAALTGLAGLGLDNTQVSDLNPLRPMIRLAEEPQFGGLSFRNIPATTDPQVAEIAQIKDDKDRAAALFALLDAGWQPPVTASAEPLEPDPLLRSLLIGGRLEIAPDPPTEEERRDRVKAILHERLTDKSRALATLAGNEFYRLANRARALVTLLDRPFDDLDLLSVHLEIEDLEARRETGTEDGVPLTEGLRQAIADVTRAGPGLTLGHPDVDLLLARRRQARTDVVIAADDAAHRRLSEAIVADTQANGPKSREMEELLRRIADQDAARALTKAKHQNLLWLITVTFAGNVAVNVAAGLITPAISPAVTNFVSTNWTTLSEVAATYGPGVLLWFQQNVGPLVGGLDTSVIRQISGLKPRR